MHGAGIAVSWTTELDEPTECAYLYYVIADEDGRHVFASELWQHERNIELARQAGVL